MLPPKPINIKELDELVKLREALDIHKYPLIERALMLFRAHDNNGENALKHLGNFSILEGLLSHAPKPSDSADSITKQLIRNLTLLNNRMPSDRNLLFDSFGETKSENIIKKLYEYLSSIAHGSSSDKVLDWFKSNRPKDEGESTRATEQMWFSNYLRIITKRVIIQSMREPQLVNDLK